MTPLERLWNGWRATYVQSVGTSEVPAGQGSIFTRILASGMTDEAANIVHRGDHVFAILNAYPYGTGHTLVLPYREVADLEELLSLIHICHLGVLQCSHG